MATKIFRSIKAINSSSDELQVMPDLELIMHDLSLTTQQASLYLAAYELLCRGKRCGEAYESAYRFGLFASGTARRRDKLVEILGDGDKEVQEAASQLRLFMRREYGLE
ncbi:MAG: hypothetical protein IT452_14390 [Planctomycetia bacterium]|nr:hypothetical protein [Planctomycetia bacterium]